MVEKSKDLIELRKKLLKLTKKEISLDELAKLMDLSVLEVFGLINDLKREDISIYSSKRDDGIYLYNQGETLSSNNALTLDCKGREIKVAVISDTMLGSKYAQLSILNDIYQKAADFGCDLVLHCGNISAGLYRIDDENIETLFREDSLSQASYIIDNYPYIAGLKTYFITGKKDATHLKKNKINIGRRISLARDDMIFCGDTLCDVDVLNTKISMMSSKLVKTYTISYRNQQMARSFREEDKPDILLMGGLLQMEKFQYRDIHCLSVPSVTATTREMKERRHANTIGAWYLTIKFNSKGKIERIVPMASPYYVTRKNDYKTAKVLKKEL